MLFLWSVKQYTIFYKCSITKKLECFTISFSTNSYYFVWLFKDFHNYLNTKIFKGEHVKNPIIEELRAHSNSNSLENKKIYPNIVVHNERGWNYFPLPYKIKSDFWEFQLTLSFRFSSKIFSLSWIPTIPVRVFIYRRVASIESFPPSSVGIFIDLLSHLFKVKIH